MEYKTIDGLIQHLRANGITISDEKQKRQLMNTGYFHGYKGYRFFEKSSNKLSFISYDEIHATIQYDLSLKSLFYGKIMYIETAVKNIALESILVNEDSRNIQDMYDKVILGYNNAPTSFSVERKKRAQQNKLNLQKTIQANIAYAYSRNDPKITHFYHKVGNSTVPVWALFEIITMGDLGFLLSCLIYDVRNDISQRIGINVSSDTDRQLIYKYIYALKDLRNAIAHNDVIFDTRFRKFDPNKPMKQCLINEIGLSYVNFKTIGDYVVLVCYYLKLLEVPNQEIIAFIEEFDRITDRYKNSVNDNVANLVVHPDLPTRIIKLKSIF